MRRLGRQRGFSLVELMVVIGIIGVLATIALFSLSRSRELAKVARAKGDIKTLSESIGLLGSDTGKWPNGCPLESVANPEVDLSAQQAGIKQQPAVGDQGDGCFWSANDLAGWNGPYATFVEDPWGNPYYFDPDYRPYENCGSKDTLDEQPVVFSFGPNGEGLNDYDCDDIWRPLR